MYIASSELEALLTERQVANLTRMSLASVRRWRRLNRGPKYLRLGGAIRYKPQDVLGWLESRLTGGGHEQEPEKRVLREPLHGTRKHE